MHVKTPASILVMSSRFDTSRVESIRLNLDEVVELSYFVRRE